MGKKAVSHQSLVATKISEKDQKYQFQSLIKVLKPKVYITDGANFKSLVQELTGDGNSSTWSPPSMESRVTKGVFGNYNSVRCDQTHQQCQYQRRSSRSTVETSSGNNSCFTFDHRLEKQIEYHYQSCSVEVSDSIDASTGSPVSSYNTNASDQECDLSNLKFGADDTSLQEYMINEMGDLFAYQEIESFLMDDAGIPSLYNCLA